MVLEASTHAKRAYLTLHNSNNPSATPPPHHTRYMCTPHTKVANIVKHAFTHSASTYNSQIGAISPCRKYFALDLEPPVNRRHVTVQSRLKNNTIKCTTNKSATRNVSNLSVCELPVLCGKDIQLHSSKERGDRRKISWDH